MTTEQYLLELAQQCAAKHGSTVSDMRSAGRKPPEVAAREEFAWRGNNNGYSFPEMSRFLCRKDHSGLVLAYHRYEKKNGCGAEA